MFKSVCVLSACILLPASSVWMSGCGESNNHEVQNQLQSISSSITTLEELFLYLVIFVVIAAVIFGIIGMFLGVGIGSDTKIESNHFYSDED